MDNGTTDGGLGARLKFYAVALAVLSAACVPASRRLPEELPEVSGAAFSADGTLLAINDSGNRALLYAVDSLGAQGVRAIGPFRGNTDWEALAIDPTRDRVAICDVGDNRRVREHVDVTLAELTSGRRTYLTLRYPDGAHDCEACLLRGDTITLITKSQTLGGGRTRRAYVYAADLRTDATLSLVDSFALRRRSVTDALYLSRDTLAVLAYDFRFLGPLPLSRTSVYVGTLDDFRASRARRIHVRAPFTLTQYEVIADPRGGKRRLLIASERTPLGPQRFRYVRY